jgi:hypothetical protein
MTRTPQVQPRHRKPMHRSEAKANKTTTCKHGHDLKEHGVWRQRGASMTWRCRLCENAGEEKRKVQRLAAKRIKAMASNDTETFEALTLELRKLLPRFVDNQMEEDAASLLAGFSNTVGGGVTWDMLRDFMKKERAGL